MKNKYSLSTIAKYGSITFIVLYLAPYVLLGENGYWMIWDNLDSNFVWYQLLMESGKLFAPNNAIIEQPLGGLPRGVFPSEFSIFVWLYVIFGSTWAYIINRILITIIGFIGMYLLLQKYILPKDNEEYIRLGVALCFALLPFWPFGGLSVAGQPLALYTMLQIRDKNYEWWNWAVVILYPFYSSLVLSGFFFLVFVSMIWVYDIIKRDREVAPLFYALFIMSLFYIFTHYRLLQDFIFNTDFISHRVEMLKTVTGLKHSIIETLDIFVHGQAHAHSKQNGVILVLALMSLLFMLPKNKNEKYKILFCILLITIGIISLFHGFKSTPPIHQVVTQITDVLPMQLDRFYFLLPLFWVILFAIILKEINKVSYALRYFVLGAILLQALDLFNYHEYWKNRGITFSQYKASELFYDIKQYINKPINSYRVASIGIHPTVSLLNDFYTLDGYWSNYPLEYKHNFREIIADELEKDDDLRQYYDHWGSRVYLFNAVTKKNMIHRAGNEVIIDSLDFDWEKYYELGGRYLLSGVYLDLETIKNINESHYGLVFHKKFTHKESAWDIYLYEIEKAK